MAEFEKAQALVGLSEGGYQNDPRDTGNYYQGSLIGTNWGISAPTLAGFLGRVPTTLDMKNLSKKTAEEILKANYWTRNNLDKIKNQSIANLLYDGVVNHGSNGMRMLLSKALDTLGAPIAYYDIFTDQAIKTLNQLNEKRLFFAIKKARADKYRGSSQTYYIDGWLKRLDRIQYYPNNSISSIWPIIPILLIGIVLISFAL